MENELGRVLQALPGFVWTARPDGHCDFFSVAWCEYTGLSLQDASGWRWQSAVHPVDLPEVQRRWRAVLASGEAGEMEARLRRSDGQYRWFLVASRPLRDEAGKVLKWLGLNTDVEDRKRLEEAERLRELHIDIDERKRTERAMRSNEHDLRSIIEAIPMTAWATHADGYCDFVNQRWLDYAGLSLDQVQGWGWGAAIHPDDLERLVAHWQSCLASGVSVSTEARMRRFDGVYRWFLFLGNPLRDESGNIVKWFGTNVDIEDRKRADEALQASERSLVQIINTIPTTAWSTRPDGYCDFLSDRWLEYAGFCTMEEALGWKWGSVIHPDDAAGLLEHWQACLASGSPGDTEARMRRFDGEYRWFLFRVNPFRDASGTIVKWYGTNVDIEDRKKATEALSASERALRLIINAIPMLAWSTEPDGFCDFLNQRWLDYAGMTIEEARGWAWGAAIHPDDVRGLVDYWRGCLASGTAVDTEARMRRFDGEYRWFLFRANPLRDDSGNIIRWYGTNVDIEDRKRAEEELRRSEAFLAEGQRRLSDEALEKVRTELAHMTRVASLGAMTASIVHEVNQPLSGILTNANTCLRMLAANPPNIEGALETARRTIRDGNRATGVITRLRALFSKKSAANESVDLNEATREVIALSVNELRQNRVTLHTEFADDLLPVMGDRIQLQQVILNLLMNACEAMNGVEDRPRQLVIRTERDAGDCVRLSVQDAGVGIAPEDANRLFEAFYTTKATGMGVGLSVSRSIIENHDGRLWAKPNDGPGVTLSFCIPYRQAGAANSE
jgi:PAS domain S-box-containing protein